MNSELVSVIIPTYNRYHYLLNAVESVRRQTHKNIEIIIVNDCSTQADYYQNRIEGCIVIHLDKNSKERFGHKSPGGFQRSVGMKIASGQYIAFLDDDDIWFPDKLERQLESMKSHNVKMSCTDGLTGNGVYQLDKDYRIYNKEKYFNIIKNIFKRKGKSFPDDGFPKIWNRDFLNTHNCCIASSVMIHRDLINYVGYFSNDLWAPDYEYWKRLLEHTDCVYVDQPLIYYDAGHGDGQLY